MGDLALVCPTCHEPADAFSEVGGQGAPQDGDVAVCGYCCGVAVVAESEGRLTLRVPAVEERGRLLLDHRVLAAWAALLSRASIAEAVVTARLAVGRRN